jgi:16S rRNA (adenine1518-N6/adenine1519-N6)-dimethyltransferase
MERTTKVRPKKFLGQHFLHDQSIARRIVGSLVVEADGSKKVLEIGPGVGVLTKFLMELKGIQLKVIEIDRDSVAYLKTHYPSLDVIEGDVLKQDIERIFSEKFSIIGNFPYNISSQIFFRILENRSAVEQVVCMLQKEVADRIAADSGNKTYGILSVLLQAYYDIEYLFKVSPGVFTPPPKVLSAVIRLRRNKVTSLPCDESLFVQVVKQGFNTRRKTLRNSLKNLNLPAEISALQIMDKRAEQLSVDEFVNLTLLIDRSRGAAIGRV